VLITDAVTLDQINNCGIGFVVFFGFGAPAQRPGRAISSRQGLSGHAPLALILPRMRAA
jgi:hypothetical protein